MEAIATVNLAHPNGGPPLPYGTPVQVDESDPFTKAHLDSGMLVPTETGATQVWDEHAETISTGRVSDLGFDRPVAVDAPAADDSARDDEKPQAKPAAKK